MADERSRDEVAKLRDLGQVLPWTPVDASGAGLVFTGVIGWYLNIGRLWICAWSLIYPATADGSNAVIGGLPMQVTLNEGNQNGLIGFCTEPTAVRLICNKGQTTFRPMTAAGANIPNATLSGDSLYGMVIYYA